MAYLVDSGAMACVVTFILMLTVSVIITFIVIMWSCSMNNTNY